MYKEDAMKKNNVVVSSMTSDEFIDHHSIDVDQLIDEEEERLLGEPVETTEYVLIKQKKGD